MRLPLAYNSDLIEAGIDEAGRGCLAGPVVAAAVILPPDFANDELTDSKALKESARYRLEEVIKAKAVAWSVASATVEEIGEINILNATLLAMHRAVAGLQVKPEHLAVDGNRFKDYPGIPHTTIVKGDAKYANIAAASVLAKTARDRLMMSLHTRFPQYCWDVNKGYPTKAHRRAIAEFGACELHRPGFKLL